MKRVAFCAVCILLQFQISLCNDAYSVDISGTLGRIFDGIGAISGGGATSKLLTNYPEEQRSQVLDFLFKPNFGAALQIFKVEIGGDAQSTEGTEASHMHYSWEANFHRGYEWSMMKEARQRNPDIKLYGLPWGFPGWLGNDTRWPYVDVGRLADYVVTWVQGAHDVHNLTIDYLGIWNEKPYDISYVKTLRKTLDARGFSKVKLVVGDLEVPSAWEVAPDIKKDPDFNKVVDFIGIHYPGTIVPDETKNSGKPLWSSEDYSDSADDEGARCWAKLLNRNYVNGLITSTIAWNMLASYYDNLPIARHSLMVANEPWSGHFQVSSPIWITAHTTQFTAPGWQYLNHGSGVQFLNSGGSVVSLISPDKKDLTIIIETIDTCRNRACKRGAEKCISVSPQNITLDLKPPLNQTLMFNMWQTQIGKEYFIKKSPMKATNGKVELFLGIDEVVTLTTLKTGSKGSCDNIPISKTFPLPYQDSFDATPISTEGNNFAQQVGAFEVIADTVDPSDHFLQQMALQAPVHWCPFAMTQPITYFGNFNWTDIRVAVDVRFPKVNSSCGVFIAAHVDQGGCYTILAQGVYYFLQLDHQETIISMDLTKTMQVGKNSTVVLPNLWYTMTLIVKGNTTAAYLNGTPMFNGTVPMKNKHGFVALGTDNFGLAQFDNFRVTAA